MIYKAIVFIFCFSYGLQSFAEKLYDAAELPVKSQSASKGDAIAALWLAHFYEKNGNLKDAKEWLHQAAKLGYKGAIVEYGYDKPYIAMSEMACGGLKIEITTTCARIDKVE